MRRHLRLAAIGLLAVALAGCDAAAERLAEEAAEQVTGAEVDVDDDEGSFSVETDEGTFEAGSGDLAEDFPQAVPPVEGGTLISSSRLATADGTVWSANWQFDSGDPDTVFASQLDDLEAAGFVAEQEFTSGDESGSLLNASLVGEGYRVNLSVIGETDDYAVTYQVLEQDEDAS